MSNIIDLLLSTTLIWMYMQIFWEAFLSILYISIPWIFWPVSVLFLTVQLGLRISPPNKNFVKKLLGVDPRKVPTQDPDVYYHEMPKDVDKKDQYLIKYIAHRGAMYDFPENSLTAIKKCHENHCDAIEFDVMITKDNVPIVFHDSTLDRLTGNTGVISEMTFDELQKFDISSTHPLREQFNPEGEKIPKLDQVIELCLEYNQKMFIDIKTTNKEIVKIIVNTFKKYADLHQKAVIVSFHPWILYLIRKKDPRIVCGLTWRPQYFAFESYNGMEGPNSPRENNIFKHIFLCLQDVFHAWLFSSLAYIIGVSCVLLHKDVVSLEVARQWHEKGIRVFAWSVNIASEKKHFRNIKVTFLTDTIVHDKIL